MNTNIDITEMFNEKNQTIFLNKLLVDLENNAGTFKLRTKHIVMVEVAKLFSSLKRLYEKYSISYDETKIKELLSNTKKGLIENINIVIDDKKSSNAAYVEGGRDKPIKRPYLKGYHKHIDDSESSFEEAVSLTVKEDIEIGLYNKLVSLYPCSNIEMQQDIIGIINLELSHTIISRVIDESKHRNMTLKNISEETFQKYLELSHNSNRLSLSQKIKIKSEK